jgi:hypothetical protein
LFEANNLKPAAQLRLGPRRFALNGTPPVPARLSAGPIRKAPRPSLRRQSEMADRCLDFAHERQFGH